MKHPTTQDWNRMCSEGLSTDGETNTKFPFSVMCRKFGLAFIEYLKSAYSAKDTLSDEEFCRLNGGLPTSFLDRIR